MIGACTFRIDLVTQLTGPAGTRDIQLLSADIVIAGMEAPHISIDGAAARIRHDLHRVRTRYL